MPALNIALTSLLGRLEQGGPAGEADIEALLALSDPSDISLLFETATRVRARHFSNRIFLYGFLYFSTFCRNNCRFCQYRRANTGFERYRKTFGQILEAAKQMADLGVHLIDLTMGEDPVWHEKGAAGFDQLVDLARQVREETRLPVMISPGVLPDPVLEQLAGSGIDWYACYQETHNRQLYATLRPGQDYDARLDKKRLARDAGMLIEEGLLTGVGETRRDIARSILWMKSFGVDQARVMTFVPQTGTPMAQQPAQGSLRELVTIAVMRLVMPDGLIPASLDVDGLDGLSRRLAAGANVVTSIVPPKKGLAGVANHCLDIEASRRNLDHILPVLKSSGLEAASVEDYRAWIGRRRMLTRIKSRTTEKIC